MSLRAVLRFFVLLLYLDDTLLGDLPYASEPRLCNSHVRTEQDVFQMSFHDCQFFVCYTGYNLPPQEAGETYNPSTHSD